MLGVLILIIAVLWFLGFINISIGAIPFLDVVLFTINGQDITLLNLLIFLLILAVIGILPTPFREIAGVILILWVLSLLGILAIAGLSGFLIPLLVIGVLIFIFAGL